MKQLSNYELACGGVQCLKVGYNKLELYKEHNVYHVRAFSQFTDTRLINDLWLTFETLDKARKCFDRQANKMKGK